MATRGHPTRQPNRAPCTGAPGFRSADGARGMRNMTQNRQRGFTLVELMVVVVIVAILASIGIPSYREHMQRANRAEAKSSLLEDAQFLERNRTATNKYNKNASDGVALTQANLPATQSPKDGEARYTIELVVDET